MCPATLARGWLQRLLQCAGETRGRMETEAGVAGSKLCRLPVELLALHPALPSPLPRACLTTPPLRSRPPPLGPRCPAGAAAGADRGVSPAAAGGGQLPSQAARPQHAGGRGAAPPGWAAPPGLAVVLRAASRRPDCSAARRSSAPTRALASTDQPPVVSPPACSACTCAARLPWRRGRRGRQSARGCWRAWWSTSSRSTWRSGGSQGRVGWAARMRVLAAGGAERRSTSSPSTWSSGGRRVQRSAGGRRGRGAHASASPSCGVCSAAAAHPPVRPPCPPRPRSRALACRSWEDIAEAQAEEERREEEGGLPPEDEPDIFELEGAPRAGEEREPARPCPLLYCSAALQPVPNPALLRSPPHAHTPPTRQA